MGKQTTSKKTKNKKGGAGKFFLGALLGAVAGAFAVARQSEPECKECSCKKAPKKTTTAKKPVAKKTTKK